MGFGRTGGYRVLSRLGTEWSRLGHRVQFLAHYASDPPYHPTEAEVAWFDDRGSPVSHPPPPSYRPPKRRTPTVMRGLLRSLRRHRDADLVLANQAHTAWPVALAPSNGLKCYYIQAYEPEFFTGPGPVEAAHRLIARLSYRLPLRQIANAPLYIGYKEIRAKEWVPPGVDLDVFRPEPSQPASDTSSLRPFTVGCIGRQEGWKGTAHVVEAVRHLQQSGRDVRLRVAYTLPDGADAPPGTEVVVPRDDRALADFYRSLDVQVAPGTLQLGAVHYPVLEAMACGVPVVTTGYLPAASDNSWIIGQPLPEAIAVAVKEIEANPEEVGRRLANGLDAARPYQWTRVSERLLSLMINN